MYKVLWKSVNLFKCYWDNIRDKLRYSSRVKEVKLTYSSAAGSTTISFLFYCG